MTRLVAAALVALAGLRWMRRGPYRLRSTRELRAVGYTYQRLQAVSIAMAVSLSAVASVVAASVASRDFAILVGTASLMWSVQLTPAILEAVLLTTYRRRRSIAALFFLRRLRLLVASGQSLTKAAQNAAETETDPAFGPVRAAVFSAVSARGDTLTAIATALAGSPVEEMLGTATSAERSGSAAGRDLDDLIDRAVAALEDERRVGIDRLGRNLATYATIVTLLPITLITLALMSTIT